MRFARPLFVFYHAGRLHRRRMYVGVHRNDNLFCVATHIRMNLLTNLWLKFIASKRPDLGAAEEGAVGYTGYVNITADSLPVIIDNSSFFSNIT